MPTSDILDLIMRIRNLAQFLQGTGEAAKAVEKVGTETEKSGQKAKLGWKGLAKYAAGAGAVVGAAKLLKDSVGSVESLAKSTMALQRQTNLDTQTASEWVGVLKERGIATSTFQVGLKTLSKQMEGARTGGRDAAKTIAGLRKNIDDVAAAGGKKAPAELNKLSNAILAAQKKGTKSQQTFRDMGISLDAVRKGDTKEVLLEMSDALSKMKNPAERSTFAQKMLGKSGIALLPILLKGRKAIEEQLDIQHKYGNYLSGKGQKSAMTLVERQREMHAAMEGTKVQLGLALMPIMLQLTKIMVAMTRALAPLTKNALAFKIAVGLLAAAFIILKINMIATEIASGPLIGALAAISLPVWLIIGAVIALIAIGVLLWKNWDTVSAWARKAWGMVTAAVQGAMTKVRGWISGLIGWVKANWPLLLGILGGPIGLAAAVIITHFKEVKRIVLGVVDAIRQAFENLINFVKNIPGKIAGAVKKIPGGAKALQIGGGLVGGIKGVLQHGGVVNTAGRFLVGERGPELVNLPRGTAVSPLSGPDMIGGGAGHGGAFEVVVPLYLDGREVARSVARVAADKMARR